MPEKRVDIQSIKESFDIASLESKELMRLFRETTSYIQEVKIEMIRSGKDPVRGEAHPAATIGFDVHSPIIWFIDSLDREQRVEVLAHELCHLLLIYRYGMGVISRKSPRYGDQEDVFRYFMSMTGDWVFLLGQIANTVHHLILGEYLRMEYRIESHLHSRLLHHNFQIISREDNRDKESLYAKGLIAFEYEKLIGTIDGALNLLSQKDPFWRAYSIAQKCFGRYCFPYIPTPSTHKENIYSFLEDLGYKGEDFIFFP